MEDILRTLIAFRTVSGDKQAADDCLRYCADFLAAHGMHIRRFEWNGFPSLVATTRAGSKTPRVMLAAHLDVVPAEAADFTLQKQDGVYLGRGVLDMKFAVAAYLQTVQDLGTDLRNYDFGIMLTTDEEVGGRDGVARLVDEGYIPGVCVLPDGGDNWNIQTASKGFLAFAISTEGKAAHGSRPWQGDNAITKLLGILDEIATLFPRIPDSDSNTISLNRITGGEAMNQVPSSATMSVDIRTINRSEHNRLFDAVTSICHKHGATYQHISDATPTSFDLQDPLIAPFADLVTKRTGVPQRGFRALGSSDVRFYVPFGVPCISVYPTGGHHHATGEWLDEQALSDFQAILADYLELTARSNGV